MFYVNIDHCTVGLAFGESQTAQSLCIFSSFPQCNFEGISWTSAIRRSFAGPLQGEQASPTTMLMLVVKHSNSFD